PSAGRLPPDAEGPLRGRAPRIPAAGGRHRRSGDVRAAGTHDLHAAAEDDPERAPPFRGAAWPRPGFWPRTCRDRLPTATRDAGSARVGSAGAKTSRSLSAEARSPKPEARSLLPT